MVRVVKDSVKCFNPAKCSAEAYLQRLLFVHRNTVLRGGQTPAEILLRHSVRCPILSHFSPSQELLYRPHRGAHVSPVKFLFRKGSNTSLVSLPDGRTVTAHDAQIVPGARGLRRSQRARNPVRRFPDVDPAVEFPGCRGPSSGREEDVASA